MFYRNFASFICIFVPAVIAAAHNYTHSVTASELEGTVYLLTTENPGSSTREPDQQVVENTAVDLGALLDAGDGAVVTLVTGDRRLAAHKAVLTARSPVFAAKFQRMTLEASTGEVVIPDVEGPVLRQMLAYMYTLQAPQLPGMATQLLVAADTYGLSALKAHCEQQVAAQLSVETAVAAAVLAVRHSCTSLRQAAVAFIRSHIFHVMATQGWADAMNSQPADLMKVIRLLSDPPAEASVPAAAGGSGAAPTTQPRSDHSGHRGQTHASATPPTASLSTSPSDDAVSRLRTPAPGEARTTPTTQPHSDHSDNGRTPAPAGQTAAAGHTTPTEDAAESLLHAPAPAASGAAPATRPHSDHSIWTPASAAPTTAAHETHTPDYIVVSYLQSLSADWKNRRLIKAAKEGAVQKVEELLPAGADVGATDERGYTALHWAAQGEHVEVVEALLAAGADMEARSRWGETALHLAAYGGHVEAVKALLAAGADVGARSDQGYTALHFAAYGGRVEVVKALLAAGVDVGARGDRGYTALHWAAQGGHVEAVEALLAAGADAGSRGEEGYTPLHRAAAGGHVEVARRLLAAGAEVDGRDRVGETPLYFAAALGQAAMVRLLVEEASADPNAREKSGWTPLHAAATSGRAEVVAALLQAGAAQRAKDDEGRTPLDIARRNGHQHLVDMLRT